MVEARRSQTPLPVFNGMDKMWQVKGSRILRFSACAPARCMNLGSRSLITGTACCFAALLKAARPFGMSANLRSAEGEQYPMHSEEDMASFVVICQLRTELVLIVREAFCLVLVGYHAPSCRLVKSHYRSVMNSQPDGILSLDGRGHAGVFPFGYLHKMDC